MRKTRVGAAIAVLALVFGGCAFEKGPFVLTDVLGPCLTLERDGTIVNAMMRGPYRDAGRGVIVGLGDDEFVAEVGDTIVVISEPKRGDYPRTCEDGDREYLLVSEIKVK